MKLRSVLGRACAQAAWLGAALIGGAAQAQAQAPGVAAPDAPTTATQATSRPGTDTLLVSHGGQQRKVIVHLPPALEARRPLPLPLVLALHGGGGHAEFMADDERYGLRRKADEAGFIVAFPNGSSRLPGGRLATWNAGGCCGQARDRQVDDVGFLRAVVAAIQARWPVDAGRIYATGMSNGGMMAHRLACDAADLFRAVAAVAGTDGTTACRPVRPVPVLHIHARDDDHVRYEGGAGKAAFGDGSQIMDFTSVPETMSRWAARNGCGAAPRRVLDRPGAWCETWGGCSGGALLELCVTQEGGHSWPGAGKVRRGKPAATQALDANDVIWDFFVRASAAR